MPIQFIGCSYTLDEAASEMFGILSVFDIRLYDGKLVAAQTCDGINLPDADAQSVGDRAEQLITHRVPKGIVDLLKAIEIQTEQSKAQTSASLRNGLLNALGQ